MVYFKENVLHIPENLDILVLVVTWTKPGTSLLESALPCVLRNHAQIPLQANMMNGKKTYMRKDRHISKDPMIEPINKETIDENPEMKKESLFLSCDIKKETKDTLKDDENFEHSLFRDPMIEDIKEEKYEKQDEINQQNFFLLPCDIKTETEEICNNDNEDPLAL